MGLVLDLFLDLSLAFLLNHLGLLTLHLTSCVFHRQTFGLLYTKRDSESGISGHFQSKLKQYLLIKLSASL